jgi:hypothetical protein
MVMVTVMVTVMVMVTAQTMLVVVSFGVNNYPNDNITKEIILKRK